MRIDITATLNSPRPDRAGEVALEMTRTPVVIPGDTSLLGSLATKPSLHAPACIYCGDTEGKRSKEHVIPHAWGGNLQIFKGSCEKCQEATSGFEGATLNQGAMANVRMALGIQSRSGHQSADDTIDVTFIKNGEPVVETIATTSVPLILGFPWFLLPSLLSGDDQSQLALDGWLTTSIGPDADRFLKEHGATGMQAREDGKNPVAFARTIAKIAYCYAWIDGVFEFIDGREDLVRAFMHVPDLLGRFVGMKPEPFERCDGMDFRLMYRPERPGLLYMEVQPLPHIPAPTYLVVLGRCKDIRTWRRIRARISKGIEPMKKYTNIWAG